MKTRILKQTTQSEETYIAQFINQYGEWENLVLWTNSSDEGINQNRYQSVYRCKAEEAIDRHLAILVTKEEVIQYPPTVVEGGP
jgi:S-adenosylmethionine:tRNA-ribosyltransferase-isomerase (queuine synthetase)